MAGTTGDAWWGGVKAPRTLGALTEEVRRRLEQASSKWGWVHTEEARADLGREAWAAIHRFLGNWQMVCERSTPDGLREEAQRLAEHLWKVRFGERQSLGAVDARNNALCSDVSEGKLTSLLGNGQGPAPSDQMVTGKNLALILAHILEGDPTMTPVSEAQDIHITAESACRIAVEVLSQWKQNPSISKITFRRILVRRLKDAQTKNSARA